MWSKALRLDGLVRDPNALDVMMVEYVCRHAKDFALVHFRLDYYPFSAISRRVTPFLTTLRGRLALPEHQPVFSVFSSVPWYRSLIRKGGQFLTRIELARFTDCQ
jgi:hypothetical protein